MDDTFQLIAKGNETLIARELDDKLFNEGWRFVRYLKNSEVDFPEFDAQEQERDLLKLKESVFPSMKATNNGRFVEGSETGSRWQTDIEIY
mgnify:CR=1|tara:strand:+ start:359 stop:631 length:273 start_codon:yes stop_codon:yes gene_type:complete